MAWLDDSISILRAVIGDDSSPFTYCDTRLGDLLIANARMLIFELSFDISYTITISTSTISPDPSEDPFFIPLLVLKTATRIADSEYKASANSAVEILDGPSRISLAGQSKALLERVKRMYDNYDKAKLQYALGNAIGCQAVLTPTNSGGNFINTSYYNRTSR
jgi:hypothetical protein